MAQYGHVGQGIYESSSRREPSTRIDEELKKPPRKLRGKTKCEHRDKSSTAT